MLGQPVALVVERTHAGHEAFEAAGLAEVIEGVGQDDQVD